MRVSLNRRAGFPKHVTILLSSDEKAGGVNQRRGKDVESVWDSDCPSHMTASTVVRSEVLISAGWLTTGKASPPPTSMCIPSLDSSQRAELLSLSVPLLLALLPHHLGRFGILAWASVAILRDVASRFSPTGMIMMKVLLSLITTTNETLALAQATCLQHQIPLMHDRRRLREAEKHASKLKCELLVLSRQSWGVYFPRTYRLWKSISQCIEDIENIHNSIQFVLEAEVRRKLDDEINATDNGITHIRPGSWATEASLPSMV
ncbi:hypothetical protein C8F01DRAFT_1184297 [Mycena amicta]|nr:hypothetical protein C8F01DRAFT_1184297 [Mycena amicta]